MLDVGVGALDAGGAGAEPDAGDPGPIPEAALAAKPAQLQVMLQLQDRRLPGVALWKAPGAVVSQMPLRYGMRTRPRDVTSQLLMRQPDPGYSLTVAAAEGAYAPLCGGALLGWVTGIVNGHTMAATVLHRAGGGTLQLPDNVVLVVVLLDCDAFSSNNPRAVHIKQPLEQTPPQSHPDAAYRTTLQTQALNGTPITVVVAAAHGGLPYQWSTVTRQAVKSVTVGRPTFLSQMCGAEVDLEALDYPTSMALELPECVSHPAACALADSLIVWVHTDGTINYSWACCGEALPTVQAPALLVWVRIQEAQAEADFPVCREHLSKVIIATQPLAP